MRGLKRIDLDLNKPLEMKPDPRDILVTAIIIPPGLIVSTLIPYDCVGEVYRLDDYVDEEGRRWGDLIKSWDGYMEIEAVIYDGIEGFAADNESVGHMMTSLLWLHLRNPRQPAMLGRISQFIETDGVAALTGIFNRLTQQVSLVVSDRYCPPCTTKAVMETFQPMPDDGGAPAPGLHLH
ncbi:MAG: hypothetical protein RJA36_1404 [Pseudomonadota bacterium]|jgi:hypothetical protein